MTTHPQPDLARWQELRELPDETRIERLMADYFLPPIDLDLKFEDALRAVSEQMGVG